MPITKHKDSEVVAAIKETQENLRFTQAVDLLKTNSSNTSKQHSISHGDSDSGESNQEEQSTPSHDAHTDEKQIIDFQQSTKKSSSTSEQELANYQNFKNTNLKLWKDAIHSLDSKDSKTQKLQNAIPYNDSINSKNAIRAVREQFSEKQIPSLYALPSLSIKNFTKKAEPQEISNIIKSHNTEQYKNILDYKLNRLFFFQGAKENEKLQNLTQNFQKLMDLELKDLDSTLTKMKETEIVKVSNTLIKDPNLFLDTLQFLNPETKNLIYKNSSQETLKKLTLVAMHNETTMRSNSQNLPKIISSLHSTKDRINALKGLISPDKTQEGQPLQISNLKYDIILNTALEIANKSQDPHKATENNQSSDKSNTKNTNAQDAVGKIIQDRENTKTPSTDIAILATMKKMLESYKSPNATPESTKAITNLLDTLEKEAQKEAQKETTNNRTKAGGVSM